MQNEKTAQQVQSRAGWLNGFMIGFWLALGIWGQEALALRHLPVPLQFPTLWLGAILLIIFCSCIGRLTAQLQRVSWVVGTWFASAIALVLGLGYFPYYSRTLTIWLADSRFWGKAIYNPPAFSYLGFILANLLLILCLVMLALLQNYRLELIKVETDHNGRFLARAWFLLLLPFPFLIGAGLLTGSIIDKSSWQPTTMLNTVLQTAVAYDGDLFNLSRQTGITYTSLATVRSQLTPTYTLKVAESDLEADSSTIAIFFDNGAWVYCQTMSTNLSFCYDASPLYGQSLTNLLTNQPLPQDCHTCPIRITPDWQTWLQSRAASFSNKQPQVQLVAEWGSSVLMRATNPATQEAIECWFSGIRPVQLESCRALPFPAK